MKLKKQRRMIVVLGLVVAFKPAFGASPGQTVHFDVSHTETKDLIQILAFETKVCLGSAPTEERIDACQHAAEREILRRRPGSELDSLARSGSEWDQAWAANFLGKLGDARSVAILSEVAKGNDGYGPFTAEMYFAQRCQTDALDKLNRINFGYGISSTALADAVSTFGKCKYKPATAHLIEWVDAASLNLVDAACAALEALYPDGPKCASASGPERASQAWKNWLRKRGHLSLAQ